MKGVREVLEEVTGQKARAFSTHDFGRDHDERCFSTVVPLDDAKELLKRLRARLPTGMVGFMGTSRWLGDERHNGVELAVGPGETQFDILRLARADACNYGMDTEDIVKKLQKYDAEIGIDIFHAETDTVELDLKKLPGDLKAFAADLYEFCPDIVDQGCGTVEELERQIKKSKMVYLWWD
jgi:hypothetical protein